MDRGRQEPAFGTSAQCGVWVHSRPLSWRRLAAAVLALGSTAPLPRRRPAGASKREIMFPARVLSGSDPRASAMVLIACATGLGGRCTALPLAPQHHRQGDTSTQWKWRVRHVNACCYVSVTSHSGMHCSGGFCACLTSPSENQRRQPCRTTRQFPAVHRHVWPLCRKMWCEGFNG